MRSPVQNALTGARTVTSGRNLPYPLAPEVLTNAVERIALVWVGAVAPGDAADVAGGAVA